LKTFVDTLTNNGKDIEAVIATHPFHSVFFPEFFEAYPNVSYYGTPRHLRVQTTIRWAGDISTNENLRRWEPEIQLRIPEGSEFENPQPPAVNHMSSVWVLFTETKTIHVDDTIGHYSDPGLLLKLVGIKPGVVQFHTSMTGPGLIHTPDGPIQFKNWIQKIINEWDFNNICVAHKDNIIGGGKDALIECLKEATPILENLSKKYSKKRTTAEILEDEEELKKCEEFSSKTNLSGNECG